MYLYPNFIVNVVISIPSNESKISTYKCGDVAPTVKDGNFKVNFVLRYIVDVCFRHPLPQLYLLLDSLSLRLIALPFPKPVFC